jgi:hypothetical protein
MRKKRQRIDSEAVREWLFFPISASGANYNPQNTAIPVFRDVFLSSGTYSCLQGRIPVVIISAFLDLEKAISFSDSLLESLIKL